MRYTLRHDIHYSDRVMVADPAGEWRTNRDYEALLKRCIDAEKSLWYFQALRSTVKEKNVKNIVFELERYAVRHFQNYLDPLEEVCYEV